MTDIDPCANLSRLTAALEVACAEASSARRGPVPRIVAVSKKHETAIIERALAGGHRLFGENRVQEAYSKWPDLKARYPDVSLHLIGPLQSNKAAEAVALFDVIETVDREKIARVLAREMARQARRPALYIQVNTGEENQKAGIMPGEADGFIGFCRDELALTIDGLMCIPPVDDAPAPHFALLAKIAARNKVTGLSMGMSDDYEIAAQMGASLVRIGSGVFGPRPS